MVERGRRSLALSGGLVVVLVLWGAWKATAVGRSDQVLIGTLFFVPFGVAAIVAALGAAARCSSDRATRTAWRLLAYAFATVLAGVIVQSLYAWRGSPPFPSAADALYLAFDAVMLAGLLRFPSGRRNGIARARFGLDLATVALGGATGIVYAAVNGRSGLGHGALAQAAAIAYPAGNMIVLAGIGAILLRRTNTASALSLRLLALGVLLFVAADLTLVQTGSSHRIGANIDVLWMIGIGLFAIAGAAEPGIEAHAAVSGAERPALFWAPYLAVLVPFVLLIADPDGRSLTLVIMTFAMGVLICARQLLASTDLLRIQRLTRHESRHDPVTGLPNRRELIADLELTLETSGHTAQRALALFDLDGFKDYNDTYGHPAGDRLLARVAQRLQRTLPPSGRAYRLGGDEFCVLVSRAELTADEIAELGADALSEQGPGFWIRASAGAVTLPAEGTDVTSALHAADRRMYANKHRRGPTSLTSQMRDVLLAAISEQCGRGSPAPDELSEHMLDVGVFARDVARALGLGPEQVELTMRTGELHDVGKIAIPESILFKPGPLDSEEWQFICKHTLIGERVLGAAPALAPVAQLVRSTHERFDGSGYPDGLAGELIPLPSRIVFACDAYHAMVATRPYAPGLAALQARDELQRGAGSQFDPRVVDALIAVLDARSRSLSALPPD